MKKHLLFTLSLVILFLFSYGQKNVDIENLKFQSVYKISPLYPQTPLFFYYGTKINASPIIKNNVNFETIENLLLIEGQRKTDDPTNSKLILEIGIDDFIINNVDIKESVFERKDKTKSYSYSLSVEYVIPRYYKILEGENTLDSLKYSVYLGGQLGTAKSTYSHSSTFNTRKGAQDYWENNRTNLSTKFMREASENLAKAASDRASRLYGFKIIHDKSNLKTMDEKKHLENIPFQEKTNALKQLLEAITPEQGLDINEVNDIVAYYQSIQEKYTDQKLKADKKLRYAAYYNLCQIYFYIDNPEKMEEYADLIIINDQNKKDGEKFKKIAKNSRIILDRTIIGRSHFNENDFFE